MVKGFIKDIDKDTGKPKGHKSKLLGAAEVQNHDGTYALQVVNAALTHPGLRGNAFTGATIDFTANEWNNEIEIRPKIPFQPLYPFKV